LVAKDKINSSEKRVRKNLVGSRDSFESGLKQVIFINSSKSFLA
jgi:hypothetical protein